MTTTRTESHVLTVTPDPHNPEHFTGTIECHDPTRALCNFWSTCPTCRNAKRYPTEEEHDDGEATIHGQPHLIFDGDLCTLTPDCITFHDDEDEAGQAANDIGTPGRWLVDVEWDEGLRVNPGTPPEPA